MRIIEEKLEHFENDIISNVTAQKDEILAKTIKANQVRYDRKETEYLTQAYNIIQNGLKKIDKERHEIISKAIMENKTRLLHKRAEVIESVLALTTDKLRAFTKSDQYENYLIQMIEENLKSMGSSDVEIIINYTDERLIDNLNLKFNNCIKLEHKNEDIIGGCRILNKSKGYFIDDSFLTRLENQREHFMLTCNIQIEDI